jgi:hypothetical protein
VALPVENGNIQRNVCHTVTLSTTNPTWKNLGSNLGLLGERPATDGLILAMTYDFHLDCVAINFQFITSQSSQSVSVELLKEIIGTDCENDIKHIIILCDKMKSFCISQEVVHIGTVEI